jgi:hypothetical protein
MNRRGESLIRSYLRYKGMVQSFPHHDLPPWFIFNSFYGGLDQDTKIELYFLSVVSFMDLTPE